MIKPAPKFLRLILRKFDAITLPPFGIYVKEERMNNEGLIRHEMCHWEQYKRMGAVKFYVMYLWYSMRYGYYNNPMEVEARKA